MHTDRLSYVCLAITSFLIVLGHFLGYEKVFGNLRMTLIFYIYPSIIFVALNIPWIGYMLKLKIIHKFSTLSEDIFYSHLFTIKMIKSMNIKVGLDLDYGNVKILLLTLILVICLALVFKLILGQFRKLMKLILIFFAPALDFVS